MSEGRWWQFSSGAQGMRAHPGFLWAVWQHSHGISTFVELHKYPERPLGEAHSRDGRKASHSATLSRAGDGVNNSSNNLRDELCQEETWGFFSFWIFCLHSPGAASHSSCRHGSHAESPLQVPCQVNWLSRYQRARPVKCANSQAPDSQRSPGAAVHKHRYGLVPEAGAGWLLLQRSALSVFTFRKDFPVS